MLVAPVAGVVGVLLHGAEFCESNVCERELIIGMQLVLAVLAAPAADVP